MTDLVARDATVDDVAELVRLRALMFESMGIDASDPAWRSACTAHLQLLGTDTLLGAVVDAPSGEGLVASGLVELNRRIPNPISHNGRVAYISSVCTDGAWRRRGAARLVMVHLLDLVRATDVTTVDLHATDVGEGLYVEMGFVQRAQREFRLQLRP